MKHQKFLLVGPPAMGKSTILRLIPSVLDRATAIDLEHIGNAHNKELMHSLAGAWERLPWNGPLFLGCAAADSRVIAKYGFTVVALFHDDHQEYLDWMNERDSRESQASQGDHWQYHNDLFEEFATTLEDRYYRISPILEFRSSKIELIKSLASRYSLDVRRNLPGEPED